MDVPGRPCRAGHGPRERHAFRSHFDGGGPVEQLTTDPGCHSVVLSHDKQRWIHVFDSILNPPRATIELVGGGNSFELVNNKFSRVKAFGLRPPELIEFLAKDGATVT